MKAAIKKDETALREAEAFVRTALSRIGDTHVAESTIKKAATKVLMAMPEQETRQRRRA